MLSGAHSANRCGIHGNPAIFWQLADHQITSLIKKSYRNIAFLAVENKPELILNAFGIAVSLEVAAPDPVQAHILEAVSYKLATSLGDDTLTPIRNT